MRLPVFDGGRVVARNRRPHRRPRGFQTHREKPRQRAEAPGAVHEGADRRPLGAGGGRAGAGLHGIAVAGLATPPALDRLIHGYFSSNE
ncbi:MAG: hypothetical protein IT548_09660 [Alphaproteobacteria bacterium]|nr:hypothetical protein [Alphaproteobacteria bacterium]